MLAGDAFAVIYFVGILTSNLSIIYCASSFQAAYRSGSIHHGKCTPYFPALCPSFVNWYIKHFSAPVSIYVNIIMTLCHICGL